jgi:hypothetical protein
MDLKLPLGKHFELSGAFYRGKAVSGLRGGIGQGEVSSSARALGAVRVILNPNWTLAHKNKYGQEYVPPPSSGYSDH